MTTSLRAHYESRTAALKQALAALEQKSDALSSRRGIVMVGVIVSSIAILVAHLPAWAWAVPGALGAVFLGLVVRHAFVASDKNLVDERSKYIAAGMRRIVGEPEPADPLRPKVKDPDGSRFLKPDHPNASDLDLFGPSSLFVAVSRAETAIGEETLAKWMLEPAPVSTILERQAAVKELLEQPELLENISIYARRAESRGRSEEPLSLWGEAPAELPARGVTLTPKLERRLALVRTARVLVPITVGLLLVRPLLDQVRPHLGLAWLVPFVLQLVVLGGLYSPISRMITFVSSRETPFGRFRLVFETLEKAEVKSPSLVKIVGALRGSEGQAPASQEIAKLERIIGFADLHHNTIIHVILNLLVLYDVWVALALERWRARVGKRTRAWLAALGEIEALASVATYAGEHPSFAWPQVTEGAPTLEAEGLGHPLLPDSTRIENDASLPEPGRAMLVTGSNMSGKSTYLRSMGLCAVMACAGMPVCAKRARLSPLATWTSMRIKDALDQGWSHFYAELVRLKAIVDVAHAAERARRESDSAPGVLFLLDEILHGTNSRERSIGARGVVLDLVRSGAIGAVSTHDFALVEIAEKSGGNVRMVHFSDHVEDGKMVFDYKLKEGVVQSTNAIRLMKAVGIDVEYGASEPG